MPLANVFRRRPTGDASPAVDTSASERARVVADARRSEATHAAEAVTVARQAYQAALSAAAVAGGPVSDGESDRLFRAHRAALAHLDRVNDAVAAAEAILAQALQREHDEADRLARAAINALADAHTKAAGELADALAIAASKRHAFEAARADLWAGITQSDRNALTLGTPTGQRPLPELEMERIGLLPGFAPGSGVPQSLPLVTRCEQIAALLKRRGDK